MSFVDCLEEYLKTHTAKSLAEQLDCSPSRISDYRRGDKPSPERRKQIIEIIGYKEEPEFEQEIEFVPFKEAAKRMGITEFKLKMGLQHKAFPFGVAFPGSGERYNYLIFRKKFEDFIEENKWP